MSQNEILLIYDKSCPVCRYYCQIIQIKKTVGQLKIVNARENSAVMDEVTRQGLDIDEGMVLKIENNFYSGADAIHKLALISTRSGMLNRLNYGLFKSKFLSTYLYPVLRFFRHLLLKLLGKTKINNLGRSENTDF